MAPSFSTHLPIVHLDPDTFNILFSWVDRQTGEMIFLFDYDAYQNHYAKTGITGDDEERLFLNGYTQAEAIAIVERSMAEYPPNHPERVRLTELSRRSKASMI